MNKMKMGMALLLGLLSMTTQAKSTWNPNLEAYAEAPYVDEAIQRTAALKLALLQTLQAHGQLDDWIVQGMEKGEWVVSPVRVLEAGQLVFTGQFCHPQQCEKEQWVFAYEPKTQALMLVKDGMILNNEAALTMREPLLRLVNISEELNALVW